jgi:hypothetical protein
MDGLNMRCPLMSVLLLVSATASAIDHDDIPINSGSELSLSTRSCRVPSAT